MSVQPIAPVMSIAASVSSMFELTQKLPYQGAYTTMKLAQESIKETEGIRQQSEFNASYFVGKMIDIKI